MSSTVFGVSYDAADAKVAALGATKLNEVRDGAHWVTLADPEGNEFDLIEG